MSYPIGRIRGLQACASPRGTFAILALDHRQNLRKTLRPSDPASVTYGEMVEFKRAVVRALAPAATGVLLDAEVGAAQCIVDGSLPGSRGLVVAIEATGYTGDATARAGRILEGWSVAQAKRMGASAVKLLVYYHPEAANAADQERLVVDVAAKCEAEDLALFLEPLSFPIDASTPSLTGDERRRVVVETARRLTRLGGDVLKAEFPYDPSISDEGRWRDGCEELAEATVLPWVVLSGGVEDAVFEAQLAAACRAGASGVVAGRSIWADAVTLDPGSRDEFLATAGWRRIERLAAIAEEMGRPWHAVSTRITAAEPPTEGWYLHY